MGILSKTKHLSQKIIQSSELTGPWMLGAALIFVLILLGAILMLLCINGLSAFWPGTIVEVTMKSGDKYWGQITEVRHHHATKEYQLHIGGRDIFGQDYVWLNERDIEEKRNAADIWLVERLEWGPLFAKILNNDFKQNVLNTTLLTTTAATDTLQLQTSSGQKTEIAANKISALVSLNSLSLFEKLHLYFVRLGKFCWENPRESNTEGGIFPAIFGTIVMVFLMTVCVTPLGVVTAVYLREYSSGGWFSSFIRVLVNNLAGVPSIVFGVFGLGFFVYQVGGIIDGTFFVETLPTPTYGSGGILWASLTLALLTLPSVVVATEEGLNSLPKNLREASYALGATRAETLLRVLLPGISPFIMTGVILAISRAAGEVAPLMLTGVVKLAPALPIDGTFPFIHLERKFMHLGFHIYDLALQSPNAEAVKPLVYATSLVLLAVVILGNVSVVILRSRLRKYYRLSEL